MLTPWNHPKINRHFISNTPMLYPIKIINDSLTIYN